MNFQNKFFFKFRLNIDYWRQVNEKRTRFGRSFFMLIHMSVVQVSTQKYLLIQFVNCISHCVERTKGK